MNFKKNIFLTLALTFCLNSTLRALDNDDILGFDEIDFDYQQEIPAEVPRGISQMFTEYALGDDNTLIPSPETILLHPLYLRTNPLRLRYILDNEQWQHDFVPGTTGFIFTPFVDFTYKSNFWRNKTTIDSYLDFAQGDLVEKLEELLKMYIEEKEEDLDDDIVTAFANTDIPDVLELFNKMKVQQKQAGGMLKYIYKPENASWKVDVRVPLLWQLYNFYLTPAEQKAIEESPLIALLGAGDFMPFAKAHLISDKFGLGDTQVNVEWVVKDKPTSAASIGISLGIPTAVAFKKGLYGSYFNKKNPRPTFSIVEDVINILETDSDNIELKKRGAQLGLQILDRVSSVLLDHPLGRDKHWTLGAYYRSRMDFTSNLQLLGYTGIICPLPATEDRFINHPITHAEVQTLKGLPHETDEESIIALNMYTKLILRKLFPEAYSCTVFPGLIFISNSCLNYTYHNWKFSLGSNTYCQMQEKLMKLKVDSDLKDVLDTSTAFNEYAYQTKNYIRIQYQNPESSWTYAVGASASGISNRIGATSTFCINVQRNF